MAAEIIQIKDLVATINNKVMLDKSLSYLSHSEYEELAVNFNELTKNIFNHKDVSNTTLDRFDDLTDMMTRIASLDFSGEVEVSGMDDHLDYIATGLNLINFHLKEKFDQLMRIKEVFNVITEPIFAIGKDDRICLANTAMTELVGYDEKALSTRSLQSIMDLNKENAALISKEEERCPVVLNRLDHEDPILGFKEVYRLEVLDEDRDGEWNAEDAYQEAFDKFVNELALIRQRENLTNRERDRFLKQMKSQLSDQTRGSLSFIESAWLRELERMLK